MRRLSLSGFLSYRDYGESTDVTWLSTLDEPLAEVLEEEIGGEQVSVRYWVTDQETTKEQADQSVVAQMLGVAECKFNAHYSETTGYLWTDEFANVGGHNLLRELCTHLGKFLILEIDIAEAG